MKTCFVVILIFSNLKLLAGNDCKKINSDNFKICLNQTLSGKLWPPLSLNLKIIDLKKVQIKFDPKLDRDALTKYEFIEKKLKPVIIIGPAEDMNELLISLNHEVIHYINFSQRLNLIADSKKNDNCLTSYQLATLKDETLAFEAEIEFWENSPKVFKKHFDKKIFYSRLTERKNSYSDYYLFLKQKLSEDRNFILKKYIDLGEYPNCAKSLL